MKTNLLRGLLSFIIILFLTLNISVINSDGALFSISSETAFATEVGSGIGASTTSVSCFVGSCATEGELQRWCGDCGLHSINKQTGDGTCTLLANPK